MFKRLKNIIQKKLILFIAHSDAQNKANLYNLLFQAHMHEQYNSFRKAYNIDNSFVFNGRYILFYGNGKIVCGANSYISDYSSIQAYDSCKVVIGKGCSISSNVRIFTQTFVASQDFSKTEKEIYTKDVEIGDYVWIGANVFINPGVTIGSNSIIGANSVVTKSIPENSIYGGVPAKLIKMKIKNEKS